MLSTFYSALFTQHFSGRASAQITPDSTLPQNTILLPAANDTTVITGGTRVGENLLHSFDEFSVGDGETALFNNTVSIQNILSRVTGASVSNIDGTIRANGTANVFLMNPNGIIFGPNASLDIGGSFVGTTANAVGLANGDIFSTNPTAPLPSQLLNVNPNAFLFNQIANQQSNSIAVNGSFLAVPDGQNLLFVGGNVSPAIDATGGILIDGGILSALSGRVELAAVAQPGQVGLNNGGLSFPVGVERADVVLANFAVLSVRANGGGNIAINARNLDISGKSFISAGIENNLGEPGAQAGNITLNATGRLDIKDSFLVNTVGEQAVGNGGNINLQARSLSVANLDVPRNIALISAETFGRGNAGNISMQVQDTVNIPNSLVLSGVRPRAFGNGGNININARSVALTDGGVLSSATGGLGNAGNITITAGEKAEFSGVLPNGNSGGLFTNTDGNATGRGGDITINTPALSLAKGAILNANTRTAANGGDITVNVNTLDAIAGGQILTTASGSGQAGDITINATLRVTLAGIDPNFGQRQQVNSDGSASGLFARTQGNGAAGNLIINAGELLVQDGAKVTAATASPSRASQGGNLTVKVEGLLELSGVAADNQSPSGLFTETTGAGDAGRLTIEAGHLVIKDGALLSAATTGEVRDRLENENNDAGQLPSTAQSVNSQAPGTTLSSIFGTLDNIDDVDLYQIFITGDGNFSATTVSGSGVDTQLFLFDANGNGVYSNDDTSADKFQSTLPAQNPLIPTQGGIYYLGISSYNSDPQSRQGDIFSPGMSIDILDPNGPGGRLPLSQWTNNGFQTGNYTIFLTGSKFITTTPNQPTVEPPAGNGGSINITTNNFTATTGGKVLTTTRGNGMAGNISFNIKDNFNISGNGSEILANTLANSTGNGGSINLRTGNLNISNNAQLSVSSEGRGNAGTLEVRANQIRLDNQGKLQASTASGAGGNINLQASDLILLRRQSLISAEAGNNGNGGNITIETPLIVGVPRENSDIVANAFRGRGGNINITTQGIFGLSFRAQRTPSSDVTASSELGIAGNVEINTPGIDPSRGFVSLPAEPVNTQVTQGCDVNAAQNQNQFIVTGRGGLPPNPREVLGGSAIQLDWETLNSRPQFSTPPVSQNTSPPPSAPILEATGWVKNHQGKVVLTTQAGEGTLHNSWQPRINCRSQTVQPTSK